MHLSSIPARHAPVAHETGKQRTATNAVDTTSKKSVAAALNTPTATVASGKSAASPAPAAVVAPASAAPAPASAAAASPVAPIAPAAPAQPSTAAPSDSTAPASARKNDAAQLKDGVYYGWGTSRHGDIQASVEVRNGKIVGAYIAQCLTQYSCSWVSALPPEVVQRQSAEVDYVSGATQSSNAFYYAVIDALKKAK
jgi:uncharacterized protein with FMN-binding domain